jgi:hypothetical protein
MSELKLTAGTTVTQLQAFQQSVGDKAEIRAKKNDDGTYTLYTHANSKFSLNRNPELRAEKQQAAFTAVAEFLKAKYGDGAKVPDVVGGLNRPPLGAKTLNSAIVEAAKSQYKKVESTLADPELRAAFRAHCVKEFSTENLDFFEAVEGFNRMVDDPKVSTFHLSKKLDRINNTFLTVNATSQVNLPSPAIGRFRAADATLRTHMTNEKKLDRMEVQSEQGNLDLRKEFRQILRESKTEIVRMMQVDTYKRFLLPLDPAKDLFTPALTRKLTNDFATERQRQIQDALTQAGLA